ncbi:MAG: TolC family protein [Vicinamibacterales bacterium]
MLIVGLLWLPARALAQDAPLRLTLQEAIARAEQNSHRVAELQARVEAAGAVEAGSQVADRPTIAALGGYTRTNHVDEFVIALPNQPTRALYPDVPDNYHARIDLQWPIYTAGRVGALERAAGAEREAAAFDIVAVRADLRLEAARAFWALVTARQTEDVLARALESTDAHVRDLGVRLDQGLIPPNEVLTAEAQRSRQRLLAIEARSLRGVAEADLRRVIGEDSRRAIEPITPLEAPGGTDARAAAAAGLLANALDGRSERRALSSRTAASREREAAAAAAGWPQVALGASYDYARPNPRIFPRLDAWRDSWDVSVNVSWTLFDGGRRRADEAEAAAGTRALLARSSEFDRQLAFEVEQRRLEIESTHAAIETAEEGVRAAVEARRVLGERFAAGVATSTEVLDADTAVLQAQLDRTRAIANARLAIARLDRAVGR